MERKFPDGYYQQFAPKGGLPKEIYKFSPINKYLKDNLSKGNLWFSKPSEFNDPFDCYNKLVTYNPKKEDISRLFMSRLTGTRQEKRAAWLKYAKSPHLVSKAYTNNLPSFIERMGVCCFSLSHNNTLMWSHYANNHSGICLIFNPSFDLRTFLIAQVNYVDDFKSYEYFDNYEDALFRMVITKSKDWEYEKEARIVLIDKNGGIPFPKEALIGVVFGCRTSQKDIDELKTLIYNAGYPTVEYFKAFTANNTFKLSFENMD